MTGAVQAAAIRRRIRIALLSNNPDKGAQLARLGITIASRVPTALHLTGANAAYLATKAQRGGHDLLSRSFEHAGGPRARRSARRSRRHRARGLMPDVLEHPPPATVLMVVFELPFQPAREWIPLRQAMSARLYRWRRDACDSPGG